MARDPRQTWRFLVERWIQKGLFQQLVLMATLVAGVACLGGLAAWLMTPRFDHAGEAVWWAFLRLTDPGYLGDDEGATLRVISTIVTILGYVLFMGSLIAIMTQWLARTVRRLESGLTPISMKGHIVVLGWTNRTPEIVLELLGARGRLKRFLEQFRARKLRIVILSDEVGPERRTELREHLGRSWSDAQVFLRSGSSLNPDHLQRLDLPRAAAIVVPGADFELGGAEASDTRVIKALLTVNNILEESGLERRPFLVAEIFDSLKYTLAQRSAVEHIEVLTSASMIGRIISQSVRHRGLAQVLLHLFSRDGANSIYVRGFPQLAGRAPRELHLAFPKAIVIGFVRGSGESSLTELDPRSAEPLRADDVLVLLAEHFEDCLPRADFDASPDADEPVLEASPRPRPHDVCRVLVLGWSHKLGALAAELGECGKLEFELTMLSRFPVEEREAWLERTPYRHDRVRVRHVVGDSTLERDLRRLDLASFDHVLLLASDFMASSEEADARTVLGYVLLHSLLAELADPPEVLAEFLDPDNQHLFRDQRSLRLVTPRILSYLLAHVALRPELSSAYDALLSAGGFEFEIVPADCLDLAGAGVRFDAIQRAALARGMTALGVLPASGAYALNPPRDRAWTLTPADGVVVIARSASAAPG